MLNVICYNASFWIRLRAFFPSASLTRYRGKDAMIKASYSGFPLKDALPKNCLSRTSGNRFTAVNCLSRSPGNHFTAVNFNVAYQTSISDYSTLTLLYLTL